MADIKRPSWKSVQGPQPVDIQLFNPRPLYSFTHTPYIKLSPNGKVAVLIYVQGRGKVKGAGFCLNEQTLIYENDTSLKMSHSRRQV